MNNDYFDMHSIYPYPDKILVYPTNRISGKTYLHRSILVYLIYAFGGEV